ncbi:sugar ABC transporter ATP-binding protein [Ensifer soli]|uniref:sugar ABC transporter ATP-binding protein n=1 Tax=Ciceribacter sp. sgz301302 TaxID=3342379 RepID=UPI0035B954DC
MLDVTGLTKTFRGAVALDSVDFSLVPGEVHALLGENGAGKSTLINLLVGTFPPDGGAFDIGGRRLQRMTPSLSRELGISAVFQEFSLVPDLTVLDNIFLGREKTRGLMIDGRTMRAEAERLLADLAFDLPLDVAVGRLSRAQKQMVEIAKALRTNPKILILDEPTASLTDGEADKLFRAIAALKSRGVAIVYVSHRMAEIRTLSDRVTVLRGGRLIGTVRTGDVSDTGLIEMMVGRPVAQLFPVINHNPGAVAFEVRGLTTAKGSVVDASFHGRKGEVVGLAGLVGCGRSELCRAIFGLEPVAAGTIAVAGETVAHPTPSGMLAASVCYFPADRGAEGLALSRPARENVTMSALSLGAIAAGPFLKLGAERRAVRKPLADLGLRPMAPERRVSAFSGGNQQKVMLARGLMRDFDVYLFDEPTVGIDVGAKADVYALIKALTEAGACVVVSTSELPELINLAARIYVMHEGAIVAEIDEAEKSEAGILQHYFGGREDTFDEKARAAR